jgi:hypothetical protein
VREEEEGKGKKKQRERGRRKDLFSISSTVSLALVRKSLSSV